MTLTKSCFLTSTVLGALALTACGQPDNKTDAPLPNQPSAVTTDATEVSEPSLSEDERLAAFFDEVFERELAFSPIFEAQLGRKTENYGKWDDASEASAAAENGRRASDLARLESEFDYTALSPEAKISYDIFVYDTEQSMRNFEFRGNQYVAHHTDSYALYLPVVLQNLHGIETASDAHAYISRIEGAEGVLTQLTDRLRDQTANGVLAPEFVYPKILTDLGNLISGAPFDDENVNAVYTDFQTKVDALNINDEEKKALLDRAAEALTGSWKRGYEAFADAVEDAQDRADGNDGVWEHPNGQAYYDNRITNYATLDNLTASDIHDLGLREVARIQDEMEAIKQQVKFEGSLLEFFEFIREDPNNYFPDTDAGREAFLERQRGLIDGVYEKVDDYFNLLPKAGLDVRRVEPFRENTAGIAFYNRPSADGARPGIYYTNLRDMTAVQKYVHTAIAYHEGAPGHHFQLALQQEMSDLPAFRKYGGYGAYIEGWALYAERVAKEMGFYEDPYEDLGRLQNEIWRAVRLVVDTGLHAKKWTREQAINYFLQNTPLSVGDATTEVERYIARPGQALSYKIGMLKIQELRAKAETELGDAFDIRDYHDIVLQNGAVPLPILERLTEQYIAAQK
ncbi:DUF885 domain-containing protein [Durusdinium trenchii]|uniref:DUF885 domain-containing protein n=1 Tax=Durusdinium trenchii TaxID=1381693 RepID=A0ABP0LS93_9DINO